MTDIFYLEIYVQRFSFLLHGFVIKSHEFV